MSCNSQLTQPENSQTSEYCSNENISVNENKRKVHEETLEQSDEESSITIRTEHLFQEIDEDQENAETDSFHEDEAEKSLFLKIPYSDDSSNSDKDESEDDNDNISMDNCHISSDISIVIKGHKHVAFLYTRVAESVMTRKKFSKLCKSGNQLPLIPMTPMIFKNEFSGKSQLVSQKVLLEFKFARETFWQTCFLIEQLSVPLILGMDFLTQLISSKAIGHFREGVQKLWGVTLTESISRLSMKNSIDSHHQTSKCMNISECKKSSSSTIEKESMGVLFKVKYREDKLEKLLDTFPNVFREELGNIKGYEHRIELMSEKPFCGNYYIIPMKYIEEIAIQIVKLETLEIIEQSYTEYLSPLILVTNPPSKPEISFQLDVREMNSRINDDQMRILTLEDLFLRLEGGQFFTSLHVTDALWQISLHENSKKYTGFEFQLETHVFRRMPRRLRTWAASFVRAIKMVLGVELENKIMIFRNDILIVTTNWKEHVQVLREALTKLECSGIRLNKKKSQFGESAVKLLGYEWRNWKSQIYNEAKMAIFALPVPENKICLKTFIKISNSQNTVAGKSLDVLEKLLHSDSNFEWSVKAQEAFKHLKDTFDPTVNFYSTKYDRKFGIEINVSRMGFGARLFQYEGETEYTITFASRRMKREELIHSSLEQECLALVWALDKWKLYLSRHSFVVRTRYNNLPQQLKFSKSSSCINRCFDFIYQFDIIWSEEVEMSRETAIILSEWPTRFNDNDETVIFNRDEKLAENQACEEEENMLYRTETAG